jgi:hypothetical protein
LNSILSDGWLLDAEPVSTTMQPEVKLKQSGGLFDPLAPSEQVQGILPPL